MNLKHLCIICLVLAAALSGCRPKSGSSHQFTPEESERILRAIETFRADVDSEFRTDPNSPFRKDTTIRFGGLHWFPPTLDFVFQSTLTRFAHPGTVIVYGTQGEERQLLYYGYFTLEYDGRNYELNVYKEIPPDGTDPSLNPNLSVWFTDETSGKETYHVGRYVHVGLEDPDPDHVYIIDMNKAYNPWCAYSSLYSCAVPRREDHLGFAVRAGEMTYSQ